MNKSIFKVNDKLVEIESITYDWGNLLISGKKSKYKINIAIDFDKFISFKENVRENISKYIYVDQNFTTLKYNYLIDIGENVYITKLPNDFYLLEIFIPKVEVLIPPYDITNNIRTSLNEEEIEIKKLELKIYFKEQ